MARNTDFAKAPIPAIEAELGRRIEAVRLAENISQQQLAEEAGLSRRTITRLENGGGISLDTLIRVLRALGVANRLDALLPETGVSPVDRVRLKGRTRQRARPKAQADPAEWTWGDRDDDT